LKWLENPSLAIQQDDHRSSEQSAVRGVGGFSRFFPTMPPKICECIPGGFKDKVAGFVHSTGHLPFWQLRTSVGIAQTAGHPL
jgi:hypothetical protein